MTTGLVGATAAAAASTTHNSRRPSLHGEIKRLFDEYRARLKQVLGPQSSGVKAKKPKGREGKVKGADQQAARSKSDLSCSTSGRTSSHAPIQVPV